MKKSISPEQRCPVLIGSSEGKASEIPSPRPQPSRRPSGGARNNKYYLWTVLLFMALLAASGAYASEADIHIPDLTQVKFDGLGGMSGLGLMYFGIVMCAIGAVFGWIQYKQTKALPVHESMGHVSNLIWETCKTYLFQQGKFLAILWVLIAGCIVYYFAGLQGSSLPNVAVILLCSILGILGSYCVAWFGIRINTVSNSRTSFSALKGNPLATLGIPLRSGMSVGLLLVCVELFFMICILVFLPRELVGPCFIGFAIGESLGASALRICGGIFTKIADIGSDLMKIVFKIKEDDARNPGVIADCTGDNAGDSVGPTADGFETYGVTGVALITFILLAVNNPAVQVQLLVWIFVMRIAMLVASAAAYFINGAVTKARYGNAEEMNFESPLTSLVWITSIVSIAFTYFISRFIIPSLGTDTTQWWKLATIISCGTLAGALIPELVKVFTSTESRHVREVVTSAQEGGASLGILSGFVAGNFSCYYLGLAMIFLMSISYLVSRLGLAQLMVAAPVFAFGLVAFGFLGMGPVTIAVDSYGPVTDNAQSIYELSMIETLPNIKSELKKDYQIDANFERAKDLLEANDGAGNTFKATAKPVLIGTAVVGATTMIFSIIMALTHGITINVDKLSLLHAPFFLGLVTGGAIIYWFTGASTQAVSTGAYRAVEFIKGHIKLESSEKASVADSKKVVQICTQYAQKGMLNIFIAVFFATLAFAFLEPFFFIGYLIAIAIFGLYQAIFMADAGAAWDNAKKIVEVELKQKGTELHAATVICDTVGDPFKDTSSVALNPVIKFTTLFGLLAVELAVKLTSTSGSLLTHLLAAGFFAVSYIFVYRSFYGMRIKSQQS